MHFVARRYAEDRRPDLAAEAVGLNMEPVMDTIATRSLMLA
ncbi:hypothetical protein X735_30335 [Mesorhizobium sp. L2C085B000]|nr:hypothetical protein X735_30335 [Mesorhizobium sp. L2C085B000]